MSYELAPYHYPRPVGETAPATATKAGIPVALLILAGLGFWWFVLRAEKGYTKNPKRRRRSRSVKDKVWYMTYGRGSSMDSDISGPWTYAEAKDLADAYGGVVSHRDSVRKQFRAKGWKLNPEGVDWDYDPEAVDFRERALAEKAEQEAITDMFEQRERDAIADARAAAQRFKRVRRRSKGKVTWRAKPKRRKRAIYTKRYCEKKRNEFYRELGRGNGELAYRTWKRAYDRKCAWTSRTQAQALAARGRA